METVRIAGILHSVVTALEHEHEGREAGDRYGKLGDWVEALGFFQAGSLASKDVTYLRLPVYNQREIEACTPSI